MAGPVDREQVHEALERARESFHALAAPEDLRRRSSGSSQQQLLFHTCSGHLVVRRLRPMVRVVGAMPPWTGRAFARMLEAAHRPVTPVPGG